MYPYRSSYYPVYPSMWGVPGLSDWGVTGVGPMYSPLTGISYRDYPGIVAEATLMGWCPDCSRRHPMPRERFDQLARQHYGQYAGPSGAGVAGSISGTTIPQTSVLPQTATMTPVGTAAPQSNPGLAARQRRGRFPRAGSY